MTAQRRSVVGPVLLAMFLVTGCGSAEPAGPASTTATVPGSAPAPTAPTPSSGGVAPTAPATGPAVPRGARLWPFADDVAVRAWQQSYRSGGAEPWHLDASATALGFVRGYLRFVEIDRVTSLDDQGADAWAGVGYLLPNGATATAAVLHLQRIGTEPDAPWEVVGTRDTSLTLDSPAYGSSLSWPLATGGIITGVDESLHVRVIGAGGTVAESCCAPAGGEATPWTVEVPKQGEGTGTLTVVVSTGGHVADVEAFAVTAVRAT